MATKKSAKKTTKKTAAKKTAVKKTAVKKTVAKKAPAKRATVAKRTVKKAAPKKAVAAKKPAKITTVKGKAYTKAQVYTTIAEHTGISKKQVIEVFDVFQTIMHAHLKKGAVGQFKMNGLVNAKVVKKPARKARKGVNPFTGEEIMIKAKPAHKVVKVSALKMLKEMAD
jgi:nucleoid DNA-binding protein